MNEDHPNYQKRDALYYAKLFGYDQVPEHGQTIFTDVDGPVESESMQLLDKPNVIELTDKPGTVQKEIGDGITRPMKTYHQEPSWSTAIRDNAIILIILVFLGPMGWLAGAALVLYQSQD